MPRVKCMTCNYRRHRPPRTYEKLGEWFVCTTCRNEGLREDLRCKAIVTNAHRMQSKDNRGNRCKLLRERDSAYCFSHKHLEESE